MQKLLGLVRRCCDDYGMISEGDRIAVGVSGGKDSLILLILLSELRKFYPLPFELEAITIDLGFPGMDFNPINDLCKQLSIPYTICKTEIAGIVFETRNEKSPCSLCAKMRRGKLNEILLSHGCNKLALGHHYDDAVNTFVMNLIYEGRIGCFSPVTYLDRSGVTQIRPLLYISEDTIRNYTEAWKLPVVTSTCPCDSNSKRRDTDSLVAELEKQFPDIKAKLFGAMQRYPLPHWDCGPVHRRPLPDVPPDSISKSRSNS